jgi:predicted lysophospholipase L1 biosynthesis ABC-type transport system permease subunit
MLVRPRALQMGWNESPAYFCAATETVRDVAQSLVDIRAVLPPHPMDRHLRPSKPARRQSTAGPQLQMSGVYVGDHLIAAVENRAGSLLQPAGRATLHAIHSVFATPEATGTPEAKDPISEKQLLKRDGRCTSNEELPEGTPRW